MESVVGVLRAHAELARPSHATPMRAAPNHSRCAYYAHYTHCAYYTHYTHYTHYTYYTHTVACG